MGFYSRVKTFLDHLYTAGGVLGALCLIAILCLIVVQMLARWFGWNVEVIKGAPDYAGCLLYTSPSPRDQRGSRMPSSA